MEALNHNVKHLGEETNGLPFPPVALPKSCLIVFYFVFQKNLFPFLFKIIYSKSLKFFILNFPLFLLKKKSIERKKKMSYFLNRIQHHNGI